MEEVQKTFRLDDAIKIAEGYRELDLSLAMAEEFVKADLANAAPKDYEKKAELYYYLIRILLRKNMNFETPVLEKYFESMNLAFRDAVADFQSQIKEAEDKRKKSLVGTQLKAFFKLIDRFYLALEHEYSQKGFDDARDRTYVERMLFRMQKQQLKQAWGPYLLLYVFQKGSLFGMSFVRIFISMLWVVLVFALLFALVDFMSVIKILPKLQFFGLDYVLLSFTSLAGIGNYATDIVVHALVALETLFGYGLLSLLIHAIIRNI